MWAWIGYAVSAIKAAGWVATIVDAFKRIRAHFVRN